MTEKPLTFQDIELHHVQNTKEIKELKTHKIMNKSLWFTLAALILLTVLTIVIMQKRKQNIKINIHEPKVKSKKFNNDTLNETVV